MMILVDTSVWIDHFRKSDSQLTSHLENNQVCIHTMVVGELACGNIQNRTEILSLLNNLERVTEASHDEVLTFIESNHLFGRGVGYVDAHLVAACHLTPGTRLWTRDKRLAQIAQSLNVAI